MSLQEIDLRLESAGLTGEVAALVGEAELRREKFYAAGLGLRYPRYIASDPAVFHAALRFLEDEGYLRGKVFCEWGSGFGIATCIAALCGFEAHGIEIEEELFDLATGLASDQGIPVEFLNLSYLPDGYDESEGVGGKDLIIPEYLNTRDGSVPRPVYDGLDPDEVDLFYVYPWPGQERMMMDLFREVASPGAVLLMYNGEGEIAAYLYDEAEEDY
ncbi:hypothetical protein [Luteolibacter marinus]|uniref:hypothetical protein n=1 Tax=Luteolibacter marinus TaxID=2776705 RepID=UPI001866DEA6|nr:hypothetical protein [Luteolibacter marinus]